MPSAAQDAAHLLGGGGEPYHLWIIRVGRGRTGRPGRIHQALDDPRTAAVVVGHRQSAQIAQASISITRPGMASAATWTAVLAGGRAVSTYSSRMARTAGSIVMSVT